ncbi:MAG TPA: uroporphyrinogen-III synthase [Propionibacteriaceae bacterium]|nr:uroporphyrinogen-III synthase [Propionibacteriaceae bacterium]
MPDRAPEGLPDLLVRAGAEVVTASFTRIEPLEATDLGTAWDEGFDWLVVTSAATAGLIRGHALPSGARIAAVGPATASSLVAAGFPVDLVAHGGGAALAAELREGPGRALLPGPVQRSVEPAASLEANGWHVTLVDVYRTVAEAPSDDLLAAWPRSDALVVTAGSVARSAVDGCGLPGPVAVAMGESAAVVCREVGLRVGAVATRPDAPAMRDAVVGALAAATSNGEES